MPKKRLNDNQLESPNKKNTQVDTVVPIKDNEETSTSKYRRSSFALRGSRVSSVTGLSGSFRVLIKRFTT